MTKEELIDALCGNFYENFATNVACEVLENGNFNDLTDLHLNYKSLPLSKSMSEKVAFRSSYVLERIYFIDNEVFIGFADRFFENFVTVTNGSMMRHYVKICADLLSRGVVPDNYEVIAKCCLDWVLDAKVKVAVKVWAVDILILMQRHVDWVCDILPSILETLSVDASPAIGCRIKRWYANLERS